MQKAAGFSFKLRHPSTGIMTEVANWFTDVDSANDQDSETVSLYNPNGTSPTKVTEYGGISYTLTLTGKWVAAADTFFSALAGATDVPYEFSPMGTAIGQVRKSGSCNVGGWGFPTSTASGTWNMSIELAINELLTETIVTPPAAKTITTSSVADPTVITTSAAHALSVGSVVVIAGHSGSTPDINKAWTVTSIPTTTTFTIPVSVTVGGTGGTVQD